MNYRQDNVILTPDQKACVEYAAGDLLIKGIAGSGKSVVLMSRTIKLYNKAKQEKKSIKIAMFTYANTLVKYTNEFVEQIVDEKDKIDVLTIDKYCYSLYTILSKKRPNIIKQKDQTEYVKRALQTHQSKSGKKHRFYELDTSFWLEEFKWMKEKMLLTMEEYSQSDRDGRGGKIRMHAADKKIAFELFQEYNKILSTNRKVDWEDLSIYILKNKNSIPNENKFDYVFVDEAQDLSYAKLCVAKEITKKSITVAADQAQKIYNTSFTWKGVGINVLGRGTKSLQKSFRSTKQIILLADDLVRNNKARKINHQEFTEPVIPDTEGPIPVVLECQNQMLEKTNLCNLIKQYQMDNANQTIAVIYKDWKEKTTVSKWLREYQINFEVIEGQDGWSLLTPGVKIVTYHSAKGLEFDTVIIPRLVEEVIPRIASDCEESEAEEIIERERNLLYVAMTRAKSRLIMLYSGEKSRFIGEMNTELYSTYE